MPYRYSNKKVLQARFVEILAFIILLPLILYQRLRREGIKRILLIEPFQMGDVLSLTPLINPLLSRFPNVEIFILTKSSSGTVLEYDSRIKRVFKFDFPWSDYGSKKSKMGRFISLLKELISLRAFQFDLGFETRGDVRSQLLLTLIGCKSRIGYLNYLHSNVSLRGYLLTRHLIKSKYMHRYEWNLELLTTVGIAESELFPVLLPSFIPDRLTLQHLAKTSSLILHIGGGWEYKRWKAEKWAQLIQSLMTHGNEILVIAGPSETSLLAQIENLVANNHTRLKFKITSLQELIVLTKACQLFIGLDSGPMNLAVCLGKKVIALFGPGDSTMWRPLSQGAKFIHNIEDYPCNPCLQTVCVFPKKSCMDEIEVRDVLSLIN